jgi:hypothetical protein
MNTMKVNGRAHDGATNTNGRAHDGADFWAVEIDLLLGEANPDENEAARTHPEGAGAADLLDEPESKGEGSRGVTTPHGRGHVRGQLACTKTIDRGGVSHSLERRHQWSWWSLLQ